MSINDAYYVILLINNYTHTLKLLIIRFSSIGDIVLTTPVIRCIFRQIKDVEIHYLTKKKFATLLKPNPYITKVHEYDNDLIWVIKQLRSEEFDYIIDLHNNLRTALVKTMLLKPSRSFHKLNFRKWLMVRLKWNVLPRKHIVNRYLETVEFLNVHNDHEGLNFFIPPEIKFPLLKEVRTTERTTDANNTVNARHKYISIVIGGNHNTKILPPDKVAEICQKLSLPIVLLGGKEDEARGNVISNSAGSHVQNLCGKCTLMESALLVKNATVVISNDTGLMHIAAAFNKPVVSLWGNTIPEFGMFPYLTKSTPHHIAEVKNLKCRPCSKIGYSECPLGHFKCMNFQDTNAISSFVNNVLKD